MDTVVVKPDLLQWACERAGLSVQDLRKKFPKIERWMRNEAQPTLKQLERFAKATYTSIGYLFLSQPPVEQLPIPDFRVLGAGKIKHPSPDLLDTVYICQQRQEWYREFARLEGESQLPFVGSATVSDDTVRAAADMRSTLGFDLNQRSKMATWEDALRSFIAQVDVAGILVMINGVVGNNNHRRLDPQEFRGFALADSLAPLVFINGSDTKSAQMFTLAHELAHIWIGSSAVSDAGVDKVSTHQVEQWCNRVAAEFLAPMDVFCNEYDKRNPLCDEMKRLARFFKVSTLVVLRRIYDAGGLTESNFWKEYKAELDRLLARPRGSGGDFYRTQAVRVSKRFARALVVSTLEGKTLHRDAFRLLGFSKFDTFRDLGRTLGVV
jgi:Zn-dependent peptidase ImmA (M78 family)